MAAAKTDHTDERFEREFGRPLAEAGRRSAEPMADVGAVTGRPTAATAAFEHPDPPAPHYWEFGHMGAALAGALPYVADGELRAGLERVRDAYAPVPAERFADLPVAVVHHDLNAFNVLVTRTGQRARVSGLIDFGDALPTARIADLAVLAASVMRGRPDPLGDVRGQGFYSGVEFVRDRQTKEPAAEETLMICERFKDEGVLAYPTGPHWNILKLKPPLSFTPAMADEFAAALDRVLEAGW
ncbi:phosphotransferase [Spongiactinospora sp. 9N601]|uniref:phosphotransferase n=1 Tax=Spongiactinospora sp. 9N601 TaxID=3375149 RepID=UPI0037B23F9D